MSTTASIANFAVNKNGKEVPIEYKASDLVNKQAPEGYMWQKRNRFEDAWDEAAELALAKPDLDILSFFPISKDYPGPGSNYDYYIAVRIDQ